VNRKLSEFGNTLKLVKIFIFKNLMLSLPLKRGCNIVKYFRKLAVEAKLICFAVK